MADETLALNVAEATMQEWLAAMLLAKLEPTTPRPQPQPHPVCVRPVFVRPAPRVVPVRPLTRPARQPVEGSGQVAGARTVYWLGLAAALAATLLF